MTILIATPLYPPQIGGPATYTKILEESLPEKGVKLLTVPFSRVGFLPKGIKHLAYMVLVCMKALRADLILALDPVSVGVPARIASFITRTPLMVKVVGDYAWEQGVQRAGVTDLLDAFSQKNDYGFLVRILKRMQSWVVSGARMVIVPSEYLKTIVSRMGAPKERIRVVYNAFSFPRAIAKEDARAELHLSGKVIVTVGRLVPWKGMQGLLEVFPKVLKKFPDTHLFIVGSGPEEQTLKRLAEKGGFGRRVIFTGQLAKEATERMIAAADVFVLHTGYEGFSHVILEAMALGTPVVTTRVGGNPELITDGQTGIMVKYLHTTELADALVRTLKGDEYAREMAERAQAHAHTFTKERMVTNTYTLLHECLNDQLGNES